MKRLKTWWWALLVLCVAALAVILVRHHGGRAGALSDGAGTVASQGGGETETAANNTPKDARAPGVARDEGAKDLPGGLPLWMRPGAAGASPNGKPLPPESKPGPEPVDAERMARMQAVLNRLQQLQQQKNPSIPDVDAALAELEKANGSSELQGLRLDVLRENLRVAARLQKLSEEFQTLQQQKPTADQRATHQAAVEQKARELEVLQGELRMDFYRGAALPTPPSAKP